VQGSSELTITQALLRLLDEISPAEPEISQETPVRSGA
jgi:hypothetical protein